MGEASQRTMIVVVVRDKNGIEFELANVFVIELDVGVRKTVLAEWVFKNWVKNDLCIATLKLIASMKNSRDLNQNSALKDSLNSIASLNLTAGAGLLASENRFLEPRLRVTNGPELAV
jgi:hypothetical protein